MDYEITYVQKQLSAVWPNWRISRKLGKGSYGNVYEILRDDLGTQYTCALKVLQMEAQSSGGYQPAAAGFAGSAGQRQKAGAKGSQGSPASGSQGSLQSSAGQRQNAHSQGSLLSSAGQKQDARSQGSLQASTGQRRNAHSQGSLAQDTAQSRIDRKTVWNSSGESSGMQPPPPDLLFGDISGSEIEEFIHSVSSEIDLMMQLKGVPNIVTIEDYAILRDNNTCTILIRMEELEPLDSFLRRRKGSLQKEEIIRLGTDICSALTFCEQKNILHRDIKTSNLFYSNEAGFKLGDFGISRSMASIREKAAMSGIGTIQYMAPEVYQGREYNNTADIYSLGIVLYILANGMVPPLYDSGTGRQTAFPLSRAQVHEANMRRLRGEVLPPPRYTDPLLASVICAACNPAPESRFQTAGAFRQALLSSQQDGRPSVPQQPGSQQPMHQQPGRRQAPYQQSALQPAPAPVKDYPAHESADTGNSPVFRIFALVSIALAAMGILLFLVVKLLSVKAPSTDTDPASPEGTPVAEQDAGADTEPHTEQDTSPSSDQNAASDTEENLTESGSQGPETGSEDSAAPVEQAAQDTEPDSGSEYDTEVAISDSVIDNPADDTDSDSGSDQKKEIQWSDNNLKSAVTDQVRAQLGISGEITVEDAMKVQKLDLTNSAISDPDSLRYFVGLTSLELGNNFISDISALSNLRKLQNLNLEQNNIEDVTPLSGLTRLKELDLNENSIEDISCLSGLTQLTMLDIRSNYINDISALKNMPQMKELYMSSNSDLHDLSPLSDMPSLWYISFKDTAVTDLTPLRRDTALTTLVMSLTRVTDISVIDNFNSLGYLDIRGCPISDYGPANRVAQRKGSTVKK